MAVFPESMNKLDVNDVPGSLGRLESYIRYMTERVEFSMRNMTRNVSDAGMSSVEVLLLLNEMANTVSVINSTVHGMTGDITALSGNVAQVQNDVSTMGTTITGLQSQITALSERVAKLEGGTEE